MINTSKTTIFSEFQRMKILLYGKRLLIIESILELVLNGVYDMVEMFAFGQIIGFI